MFVEKSAHDFYQLFAGIHDKKFFLQIVDRQGNLKYGFESLDLDESNQNSLCTGIMEACYDFFDPSHFKFDENFVLATNAPFLIRRYGEKALFEEQEVIKCKSFDSLPAMSSWLFMETFLPFEKPLETISKPNHPWEKPENNRGAWFSSNDTWHGIAE